MNHFTKLGLLLSLLISALGVAGCGDDDDDGDTETNLFLSDRVLNIAHRGGRSLRPEHTLMAYQNAIDVGADVLELDLHSTSDGVIIAIHDVQVDRTTDGTGDIQSMTLAEIKQLDAGYNFKDGDGNFPYRGQGIEVPTLEEIVGQFPNAYYVIEIKQDTPTLVASMLKIIADAGLNEKVALGSFSDLANTEIRQINPEIMTSLSMGEVMTFWSLTEETEADYTPPGMVHQVPVKFEALTVLDQAYADRAKRFGMKIHAWTINDADEMRRLIDMGVDGIITDDPVTLESVLAEYGIAE